MNRGQAVMCDVWQLGWRLLDSCTGLRMTEMQPQIPREYRENGRQVCRIEAEVAWISMRWKNRAEFLRKRRRTLLQLLFRRRRRIHQQQLLSNPRHEGQHQLRHSGILVMLSVDWDLYGRWWNWDGGLSSLTGPGCLLRCCAFSVVRSPALCLLAYISITLCYSSTTNIDCRLRPPAVTTVSR